MTTAQGAVLIVPFLLMALAQLIAGLLWAGRVTQRLEDIARRIGHLEARPAAPRAVGWCPHHPLPPYGTSA